MGPTAASPASSVDHSAPRPPDRRGRRILSERLRERLDQLRAQLLDQPIQAETAAALTLEANDIYVAFKPRNGWQDWLAGEIAVIMTRINRSHRIERRLRDHASYRAILFWEEDQQLAAEVLAEKLPKNPARVVAQLRRSLAGTDWLLVRWRALAGLDPAAWTEAQRELAGRLLGVNSDLDPTAPGFAAAQVAELVEHQVAITEDDAIARGLVESDLASDAAIPGLGQLRRYVRSLHRQMKWYADQFHVEHPDRWDDPRRRPMMFMPDIENAEARYQPRWRFGTANPQVAAAAPPTPEPTAADLAAEVDRLIRTDPIAAVVLDAIPQIDETEPLSPATDVPPAGPQPTSAAEQAHRARTNPLTWTDLTPTLVASVPQAILDAEAVPVADYATEPGRRSLANRPANPVREATERTQARTRRRAEQAVRREKSRRRRGSLVEVGG